MKPVKPIKLKLPRLDFLVDILNQRTNREKQLIIGFAAVFILLMDYVVLVQPLLGAFSQDLPRIAPLRQELKDLAEDIKNADSIRQKWEGAKQALEERDRAFVAPNETPALLENLSSMAQQAGVKMTSLEPSEGVVDASKGYTPFPIEMKATAGTHEFGKFLSNLETGVTFFRVKDIRISANPQNDRKHQVSLSLEAYKRKK